MFNAYGYKKIPESSDVYKDTSFIFNHKNLLDAKNAFTGMEKRKARRMPCDMPALWCMVVSDANIDSWEAARVKDAAWPSPLDRPFLGNFYYDFTTLEIPLANTT